MNILIIGDVVGKRGVDAVKNLLPNIKMENDIDFVIANGENSADGMGITKPIFEDLLKSGVDIVTMGNHTWGKKDIFAFIEDNEKIIRPANYAEGLPGKGSTIIKCEGHNIGIVNLIGRINMGGTYENPFMYADQEIKKIEKDSDIIVIDFHAEVTAEKLALAYYLQDKVNIFFGTHTHVQTADEKIYNSGMGYITDVGMTGPFNSIIGMDIDVALKRFLTQIPERYVCATGDYMLNGVIFSLDNETKKTKNIKRINIS